VLLQHWDLDDEHEHQGSHVFLPGGNLHLLAGLAQGLPIFYSAPARLLQYSSTGVRVIAAELQSYVALLGRMTDWGCAAAAVVTDSCVSETLHCSTCRMNRPGDECIPLGH
jgi:hypothetical protein